MTQISRKYDFVAGTKIKSQEMDDELKSLVSANNSLDVDVQNRYTKAEVDAKINSAAKTATVEAGTVFPAELYVNGQVFYRSDLDTLYVYDSGSAAWFPVISGVFYSDLFNDFAVSGLVPATSTDLTTTIPAQVAYVTGKRVDKTSESHTFTASTDTYIDLGMNGAYTYVEMANGALEPAITTNSIRLFKVVTDAVSITGVTDMRTTKPKLNKYVEATADPTTALGLATKQYVDNDSPTWLVNGYRNLPSPVTTKFTGAQKHGFFSNMAAGNTTIYTVPAGKKAFFWQIPVAHHNPTAGAIVAYAHIVPSGGTAGTGNRIYKYSTPASGNSNMYLEPSVLDTGDFIVINTDVAGLNSWYNVMEFDEADTTGYRLEFLSNVGTTVTTVYTVPAGKKAMILDYPRVFNTTAAAITFTVYFVPSGGTAGSTNQFFTASVGAEAGSSPNPFGAVILNSGDSVQVVGSAAGCNFWLPVLEF